EGRSVWLGVRGDAKADRACGSAGFEGSRAGGSEFRPRHQGAMDETRPHVGRFDPRIWRVPGAPGRALKSRDAAVNLANPTSARARSRMIPRRAFAQVAPGSRAFEPGFAQLRIACGLGSGLGFRRSFQKFVAPL